MPTSSNTIEENRALRKARAEEIEVTYSTKGHTKTEVPLLGLGPYTEIISEATHLTDIFDIMRIAIDGEVGPIGEGFYDGYYNILWIYVPAAIVGLVILGFLTFKIVKKVKNNKIK